MWVTADKTSKKQRERGHLEDLGNKTDLGGVKWPQRLIQSSD